MIGILARMFSHVNARNVPTNTRSMSNRKASQERTHHIAGTVSGDS